MSMIAELPTTFIVKSTIKFTLSNVARLGNLASETEGPVYQNVNLFLETTIIISLVELRRHQAKKIEDRERSILCPLLKGVMRCATLLYTISFCEKNHSTGSKNTLSGALNCGATSSSSTTFSPLHSLRSMPIV